MVRAVWVLVGWPALIFSRMVLERADATGLPLGLEYAGL